MPLMLSCSWCHNMNPIDHARENFCLSCGHRADKARSECTCERCRDWKGANLADTQRTATAFTRVVGRGLKSPVLSWTTSAKHAVLRVDDQDNPEYWTEISLSQDAVIALLGGMMSAPKQPKPSAANPPPAAPQE